MPKQPPMAKAPMPNVPMPNVPISFFVPRGHHPRPEYPRPRYPQGITPNIQLQLMVRQPTLTYYQYPIMQYPVTPIMQYPITLCPMPAPARPKLPTPTEKTPDFHQLLREATVKDPVRPRPRLQEGIHEPTKPGDVTVVELVERKLKQTEIREVLKQHESEQRQKEAIEKDKPVIEIGAMVTGEPARELKAPVEMKQSINDRPRCSAPETTEDTSESAETMTPIRERLAAYAKMGLGALAALLGIAGLAVGLWHFGRGIYDNLEYR